MRYLGVIAAALVLAAPAAAKPDPAVLKLQRQVAALQAEVRALHAKAAENRNIAICYYALNRDSFRTVFHALSSFSEAITGKRVDAWDQLPRFDDEGACAAINIPRP